MDILGNIEILGRMYLIKIIHMVTQNAQTLCNLYIFYLQIYQLFDFSERLGFLIKNLKDKQSRLIFTGFFVHIYRCVNNSGNDCVFYVYHASEYAWQFK